MSDKLDGFGRLRKHSNKPESFPLIIHHESKRQSARHGTDSQELRELKALIARDNFTALRKILDEMPNHSYTYIYKLGPRCEYSSLIHEAMRRYRVDLADQLIGYFSTEELIEFEENHSAYRGFLRLFIDFKRVALLDRWFNELKTFANVDAKKKGRVKKLANRVDFDGVTPLFALFDVGRNVSELFKKNFVRFVEELLHLGASVTFEVKSHVGEVEVRNALQLFYDNYCLGDILTPEQINTVIELLTTSILRDENSNLETKDGPFSSDGSESDDASRSAVPRPKFSFTRSASYRKSQPKKLSFTPVNQTERLHMMLLSERVNYAILTTWIAQSKTEVNLWDLVDGQNALAAFICGLSRGGFGRDSYAQDVFEKIKEHVVKCTAASGPLEKKSEEEVWTSFVQSTFDNQGHDVMACAVRVNDLMLVKKLLEGGYELKSLTEARKSKAEIGSKTVWHVLCSGAHWNYEIFAHFLVVCTEKGIPVITVDHNERTLLHLVCQINFFDSITGKTLVDDELLEEDHLCEGLRRASEMAFPHDNVSLFEFINRPDSSGKPAIILALENGHPELAVELVRQNANLIKRCEFSSSLPKCSKHNPFVTTPLHFFVWMASFYENDEKMLKRYCDSLVSAMNEFQEKLLDFVERSSRLDKFIPDEWFDENGQLCRTRLPEFRKTVLLYLMNDIFDGENESVVSLAFHLHQMAVLRCLYLMPGIYHTFKAADESRYESTILEVDITDISPFCRRPIDAAYTKKKETENKQKSDDIRRAHIERLADRQFRGKYIDLLSVPAITQTVEAARASYAPLMWFAFIFHIIYMSVFSWYGSQFDVYSSVSLTASVVRSNSSNSTIVRVDSNCVPLDRSLFLVEVFIFIVAMAYGLIDVGELTLELYYLFTNDQTPWRQLLKSLVEYWKSERIYRIVGGFMYSERIWGFVDGYFAMVLRLSFPTLVFFWFLFYRHLCHLEEVHYLSLALLLGWLRTIYATHGFRDFRRFLILIQKILIINVSKFAWVFLLFFVAFACAMHGLLTARCIVDDWNPESCPIPRERGYFAMESWFLVFQYMAGLDEPNYGFGQFSTTLKVLHVVFVVMMAIVFINLLIAMMNESYEVLLKDSKRSYTIWMLDQIKFLCVTLPILKKIPRYSVFSGYTYKRLHYNPQPWIEEMIRYKDSGSTSLSSISSSALNSPAVFQRRGRGSSGRSTVSIATGSQSPPPPVLSPPPMLSPPPVLPTPSPSLPLSPPTPSSPTIQLRRKKNVFARRMEVAALPSPPRPSPVVKKQIKADYVRYVFWIRQRRTSMGFDSTFEYFSERMDIVDRRLLRLEESLNEMNSSLAEISKNLNASNANASSSNRPVRQRSALPVVQWYDMDDDEQNGPPNESGLLRIRPTRRSPSPTYLSHRKFYSNA